MDRYCVNRNEQFNGDHEIHKVYCSRIKWSDNMVDLGYCVDDREALKKAQRMYGNKADGCYYCCLSIHRH